MHQVAGDIFSVHGEKQAVVKKMNELFEDKAGIGQELAAASASGIAIGMLWYAILATSTLFIFKTKGDLRVAAWIGVVGYVLAILRAIVVLIKCRKRLWACFLTVAGIVVGVGASAVITVLTCAYGDVSEGDGAGVRVGNVSSDGLPPFVGEGFHGQQSAT